MKYLFITSIISFLLSISMLQSCEKERCRPINEVCVTHQVMNASRCIDLETGEYQPWKFIIETDTLYPINECSKERLVNSRTDEWMGVKLQWVECNELK